MEIKERKRETVINYALVLLTIAYVVFVIVYDYHRINAYTDALEQSGEKVGHAIGATLVFVLSNICILGGGSSIVAIALFIFAKSLAKENGKPKKGVLIGALVCKSIGLVLTIYGACMAFSLAYADWLMKVVYTFVPTVYACAILHTAVYFRKIVA